MTETPDIIEEFNKIVNHIRWQERLRAADIVRRYEAHSPYIVGKMKIEERKSGIIAAILGEAEESQE